MSHRQRSDEQWVSRRDRHGGGRVGLSGLHDLVTDEVEVTAAAAGGLGRLRQIARLSAVERQLRLAGKSHDEHRYESLHTTFRTPRKARGATLLQR